DVIVLPIGRADGLLVERGVVIPVPPSGGEVVLKKEVASAYVREQDEGVIAYMVRVGPRRGQQQIVLREVVVLRGNDRHQLDGPVREVATVVLRGALDPLLHQGPGSELLEGDPDRVRVPGGATASRERCQGQDRSRTSGVAQKGAA